MSSELGSVPELGKWLTLLDASLEKNFVHLLDLQSQTFLPGRSFIRTSPIDRPSCGVDLPLYPRPFSHGALKTFFHPGNVP